jgi:hypothetical protein
MALEMRAACERCDTPLGHGDDARICSFECTFCVECVEDRLAGVCPNCGGGFVPRPIRPPGKLETYPPSTERITKPHPACV